MTVQDLIEILEKVKDKTKIVTVAPEGYETKATVCEEDDKVVCIQ